MRDTVAPRRAGRCKLPERIRLEAKRQAGKRLEYPRLEARFGGILELPPQPLPILLLLDFSENTRDFLLESSRNLRTRRPPAVQGLDAPNKIDKAVLHVEPGLPLGAEVESNSRPEFLALPSPTRDDLAEMLLNAGKDSPTVVEFRRLRRASMPHEDELISVIALAVR